MTFFVLQMFLRLWVARCARPAVTRTTASIAIRKTTAFVNCRLGGTQAAHLLKDLPTDAALEDGDDVRECINFKRHATPLERTDVENN